MTKTAESTIFGCVEYVSLPQFGMNDVIAKIDTGAYSGALHCSSIREVKKDGKKFLQFTPSANHSHTMETDDYETTMVRSATGHEVKRYIVTAKIYIQEKRYDMRIGLSNRSKMQREVLIGRRFLRENNVLVDTRINQELDTDGRRQYENSDSI